MYDQAFGPYGNRNFLVGTSPIQVYTADSPGQGSGLVNYRIHCIAASRAYIGWGAGQSTTPAAVVQLFQPTSTQSAVNAMSMESGGVEVLTLPPNAWFQSNTAAAFEVQAGEGQ